MVFKVKYHKLLYFPVFESVGVASHGLASGSQARQALLVSTLALRLTL